MSRTKPSLLIKSVTVTEEGDEIQIESSCSDAKMVDILKRAYSKVINSFPFNREDYERKKALKGKPQPGDDYPQSPRNWVPRHVFVERTPFTARLLDLEQQRDNVMHQIMEERLRVFGREPTGDTGDDHYWWFGVSQSLMDLMGHYGSAQVRRAWLGWAFANDRTNDLSEEAQKELYDLLEGEILDKEGNRWNPSNRWRLMPHEGTYVFPDFDQTKEEAKPE